MKKELVLDDDEKKTRFRKFLQKKQQQRDRVDRGSHEQDSENEHEQGDSGSPHQVYTQILIFVQCSSYSTSDLLYNDVAC